MKRFFALALVGAIASAQQDMPDIDLGELDGALKDLDKEMDQALKDAQDQINEEMANLEGLQIDGMDQFDSQLEDANKKLEALGDLGDKAEEAQQGA